MEKRFLNNTDTSRLAFRAAFTGSFWDMISLMDAAHPNLQGAEIDSYEGWRNLATISQFCFTLGNNLICRSVAETARANTQNITYEGETRLMMVCQASGGLIDLHKVLPFIDDYSHNAHYVASRLGSLAYRAKQEDVIEACVLRLAKQDQIDSSLADPQIELEIMLACQSIVRGEGYHRQRLLSALRMVKPQWRQRYAQHMGSLFGGS
jgi:hypothetical protein